jgi:hypothetical protein
VRIACWAQVSIIARHLSSATAELARIRCARRRGSLWSAWTQEKVTDWSKYQGGRRGRAGPIWQPFRDWLKAGPYPVAGKPLVGSRRAHRARASPVGRAEVPLPQRSGSGPLALAKSNGGRPCRRRTWHLRSRDQSCSKPRSPSGMMFLQRKRGAPNGRPVSWTDGVTGTASPSAQRCLLRSRPRTTGHCP